MNLVVSKPLGKFVGFSIEGPTDDLHPLTQLAWPKQVVRLPYLVMCLDQIARGECECFIPGDIQVAVGCTMAVPFPRSPPLTRPQYNLPNLCHNVVSHHSAISVINLGLL